VSERRLLVVDADQSVHESLSKILARDDRTILNAYDGRDALDQLKANPYDLVVAGQGHNGLGGVNLLRRLRAVRPETKVIVAGEPNKGQVLGAIRHRAYSYFHKPLTPGPLSDMVQQALDSPSWQDDIRVVSGRPEWITLDIRCKIDAADRTTHYMKELENDLAPAARDDVAAAFRELLMNAIEHGGKHDPRKRVRVSVIQTARSLMVHIDDPGKGFSLEFLPHAAISNPEDAPIRHAEVRAEAGKRPGGFGILMTRNLVDEMMYNERGNAVLFVKYLR
jgi:DNA-binding NarL/FixJ family response regulator/anti-sigma regulatory factor (Ser/Thr protein kinase)